MQIEPVGKGEGGTCVVARKIGPTPVLQISHESKSMNLSVMTACERQEGSNSLTRQ